eukprot:498845-Pyramimonas_sp.AAC.1
MYITRCHIYGQGGVPHRDDVVVESEERDADAARQAQREYVVHHQPHVHALHDGDAVVGVHRLERALVLDAALRARHRGVARLVH